MRVWTQCLRDCLHLLFLFLLDLQTQATMLHFKKKCHACGCVCCYKGTLKQFNATFHTHAKSQVHALKIQNHEHHEKGRTTLACVPCLFLQQLVGYDHNSIGTLFAYMSVLTQCGFARLGGTSIFDPRSHTVSTMLVSQASSSSPPWDVCNLEIEVDACSLSLTPDCFLSTSLDHWSTCRSERCRTEDWSRGCPLRHRYA